MQASGEQLFTDPRLPQQQHRQFRVGQHIQLIEQLMHDRALTKNLAFLPRHAQLRHIATRQAQAAVFLFKAGNPQRRLDLQGAALELLPCSGVEGTGLQGIQRDCTPSLPFDIQAHPHAVMHRQRLMERGLKQTVVRIRQAAVGLEPGRFA
ncbi:hypothetical protein D3C72_1524930 [compost metagenome]